MKRIGAGLIVLLLTGAAAPALAQGPGEGQGGPDGAKGRAARQRQRMGRLLEALDLSEEQAAQVRQILETHAQATSNWRQEHGEALKAAQQELRKAMRDRDPEAIQAARKKLRDLHASRKGSTQELLKQLDEVLNDEQMKTVKRFLRAAGGPRPLLRGLAGLELSDRQKAQIKEIMDAAHKQAAEAEGRKAKKEIMEAARKKVSEVLTDEQREKLAARRKAGRPGDLRGLDLTDEQKAQVKEIMQAAREQAAEAEGREAKMEIYKAARKKIAEDVLTEEQRKQVGQRRMRQRRVVVGRALGEIALSDEQKEQVQEIMQAARKKAAEAEGREAKREIYRAARAKVAEVLTEEQREQLREMRQERREKMRDRMRARRGRRRGAADEDDE